MWIRLKNAMEEPRLQSLLLSTFFLGLVFAALDVVLPLWLTGELGLSAAAWAHVRSLRMVGTLLSVVLLGGLSDRFGQRRLGWLALLASGVALAALAFSGTRGVWVLVPVVGGCISTAFVNMNTLTQGISVQRQGVVNAAYRGTYAISGIIAPVVVTVLGVWFGGYPRVLLLCAVSLILSALLLRRYPRETTPPFATLSEEFRGMMRGYAEALRQKKLLAFIFLFQFWFSAVSGVNAFAAIRFVRELGMDERAFGAIVAAGSVLVFGAILLSGLLLDRVQLRRFCLWTSGGASLCTLGIGLSDSVPVSAVCFCIHGALAGVMAAPMSMWVSRSAGSASTTSAFAVQKVLAAAISAVAMAALGWLEPRVGIQAILAWGGGLGLVFSLCYAGMSEPGSGK